LSWIAFNEDEAAARGRKTLVWTVTAIGGGTLGVVKFYSQWRKYAFYPNPNTLFEEECLRDIATFVATQTEAWRAKRRLIQVLGKKREIAEDRKLQQLGMTVALPERLGAEKGDG
jgi:hypothetical protein